MLTVYLEVLLNDEVDERGHMAGFEPLTRQLGGDGRFADSFGAEQQELLAAIGRRPVEGVAVVDERLRDAGREGGLGMITVDDRVGRGRRGQSRRGG